MPMEIGRENCLTGFDAGIAKFVIYGNWRAGIHSQITTQDGHDRSVGGYFSRGQPSKWLPDHLD
jgi:hypothetical protein